MNMRHVFAVAIALAGCSKTASPPAAGSADSASPTISIDMGGKHKHKDKPLTGTPRPQPKLAVTLDGKPVTIATAYAWRDWSGSIKITASTLPVACDDVTGDMRTIHDGEVTFDVDVANALAPDGKTVMQQRDTYFKGTSSSETKPITGSGDGTPGQPTTADVDFTSGGLVVKGTIDALGCTAPSHGPPATLPPEMPATLTVAGKKLPIRGAFLTKSGDFPILRLTTGAEGCKQVPYATPGELEVDLDWFKDPTVGQIDLDGTLLGHHGGDQTFDKKKLTVTPSPPVVGDITLKGDIKVSGYPVQLDGKVTAVECPKS